MTEQSWVEVEDPTPRWNTPHDEYEYAETDDPRVIAVIQREWDRTVEDSFDGDAINPVYSRSWRDGSLDHRGGWDDDVVASAWANAYEMSPWNHDASGFADRFVRIFHDALVRHVDGSHGNDRDGEWVIFDTPAFRRHLDPEGDYPKEHIIDPSWLDSVESELIKVLEGDVWGVGFAINPNRRLPDVEVGDILSDGWEISIECWGHIGEDYARSEALSYAEHEATHRLLPMLPIPEEGRA